jgi:hypothetical protein
LVGVDRDQHVPGIGVELWLGGDEESLAEEVQKRGLVEVVEQAEVGALEGIH